MPTIQEWIAGQTVDGRQLPRRKVNNARQRYGMEPLPAVNVQPLATDHRKMPAVTRQRSAGGPGTELKRILQELGISAAWCAPCTGRADQMDRWGVDGCRREIDTIAGWLRDAARTRSFTEKLQTACKAVRNGYVLNPLDPCRSLVEIAIKSAETPSEAKTTKETE